MQQKFNLGTCSLVIRTTEKNREVFVENAHEEGPIWIAIGDEQIKKLIKILSSDDFESTPKKLLNFLSIPRKMRQLQDISRNAETTIQRMIKAGAVESYVDTNPDFGRGQPTLCRWFIATGAPYKFSKPKRK